MSGFSAIEFVVFVLMAGLLAAVTTPKVIDKISETRRIATMKSLGEIRDVISCSNSEAVEDLSPENLIAAVAIRFGDGTFPIAHTAPKFANTVILATSDPISAGDVTQDGGWLYNRTTGEIRVNDVNCVAW